MDRLLAKRIAAGVTPIGSEIECADCGIKVIKDHGCRRLCDGCKRKRRLASYRRNNIKPESKARQRAHEERRKNCPQRIQYMKAHAAVYQPIYNAQPVRRLNRRISQMVRSGLGARKAGRSWQDILDFTVEDLAAHIERQFVKGMTWENMGEWHIDHVVPLASFTYATEADPGFRAAWALTNLRPLWATANLRKGATRTHLL